MNIDRLPDNIDDPSHAADTTRLTEPSPPEAPPPPDNASRAEPSPETQSREDPQATERRGSTEQAVRAEDSAERSNTTDSRSELAEPEETVEPRSRQEHANEPPAYESTDVTDAGAEDRNASTTNASADGVPDSADAIGKASDDEIEIAFAREDATENPISDREPSQEDDTGETEKGIEKSPEQEDPPSSGAEDARPADEIPPREVAPAEDDRMLPLTDKEWAEHLTEVRDTLDKARAEGLESHLLYTIDPDHQSWSKERRDLHDSIINDIYSAAQDVPNQGNAIVTGGLGGAGKTTVLTESAGIDLSNYLMINPDNLKEEMARRGIIPEIDGLSPMEASDLAHEESSYLARQIALRAQADRKNLIWDITMSTQRSTERRISDLRDAGVLTYRWIIRGYSSSNKYQAD